jgi:hypothetical protein
MSYLHDLPLWKVEKIMSSKKSREQIRKLEYGQVMVLFVFATIALLGIAALAIDGGRLYFERRAAQGASDDAAMTGALAILKGYSASEIDTIVLNRAKENGFDNDLEEVTVEVNWPPVPPNPYAGNANYIQVFITSEIPPLLTHFVYKGPLQMTVEAIGQVRPTGSIVPGYAIYGTNENACRTVEFSGNPFVVVTGGGSIGSNSTAECPCGSLVSGGNFSIDVFGGGEITTVGCWNNNGTSGGIDPEPTEGVDPINMNEIRASIPIPDCGLLTTDYHMQTFSGTVTIEPGYYESMKFTAGADVTMKPGMYCIYGDDPWIMEMAGSTTIFGDGIMIYLMSTAGSWKTTAGSNITLKASTDLVDASGNQWAGMLIYSHPDNSNQIVLTGTSNSTYVGSVYGLSSYCVLEGTSGGVATNTQVICDRVEVGGTGDLDVEYKEGEVYQVPPALNLSK